MRRRLTARGGMRPASGLPHRWHSQVHLKERLCLADELEPGVYELQLGALGAVTLEPAAAGMAALEPSGRQLRRVQADLSLRVEPEHYPLTAMRPVVR